MTGRDESGAEDEYVDFDDGREQDCTWCQGSGEQDNNDPLWWGDVWMIPCQACAGTGERKHQTIF